MTLPSPSSLEPQHSTESSVLNPQLWAHPALTETKEPPGGVAWPITLPSASSLNPQHATDPSVRNPQVCQYPALTEANEPPGGVAWASS